MKIIFIPGEREGVERRLVDLFGKEVPRFVIARIAMAPESALVTVGTDPDGIIMEVMEPVRLGYLSQVRLVSGPNRTALLLLDDFRILRHRYQRNGIGFELFKDLVMEVRKSRITGIQTRTDRDIDPVSYYALPRYGFDASLSEKIREILPPDFRTARRISDLIETSSGRDWWRKNGVGGDLFFSLTAGSRSLRIFDNYSRERDQRGASFCRERVSQEKRGKSGKNKKRPA